MVKARSLWQRTRRRNTPKRVGDFFEGIALQLLKGERGNNGEGDIVNWRGETGIEVKASDNNHAFRLPIEQLEHHRHVSQGFPLSSFYYALFCYRNRAGRGRRRSLLAGCREDSAFLAMLAQGVDTLYLVDVGLLVACVKAFGTKCGCLPCNPDQHVLTLDRRLLQSIRTRSIFSQLSLSGDSWHVSTRKRTIQLPTEFLPVECTFNVVETCLTSSQKHLRTLYRR